MSRQEQSRTIGAGSGDVAEHAPFHYLSLKLGVNHVGLDDRVHVLLVDLDDAVHPPQVYF
jgi:hypothetical protein